MLSIWVLTLQNLEVLYVGIFCVDVEFDSGHGDISENTVVHLAESRTVSFHRVAVSFLTMYIRLTGHRQMGTDNRVISPVAIEGIERTQFRIAQPWSY